MVTGERQHLTVKQIDEGPAKRGLTNRLSVREAWDDVVFPDVRKRLYPHHGSNND